MQELLELKGLPASGKSTHAKELVAKGWKRVNKDDLRAMVDNSTFNRKNEEAIQEMECIMAKYYLNLGYNVVVDDTNFGKDTLWASIAKSHNVKYNIKFFDTPLVECIERDAKRGDKSVGAKVILGMYDKWLRPEEPEYDPSLPRAYIVDIDGTIARMNGRTPYDYTKVHTDLPKESVLNIIRVLGEFSRILLVSGRKDDCEEQTRAWLKANNVPYNKLMMRKSGDDRKDSIVKKEIYEQNIKGKYNVCAVFDDRNQVVDMWRSLGFTVLQVDYGNF